MNRICRILIGKAKHASQVLSAWKISWILMMIRALSTLSSNVCNGIPKREWHPNKESSILGFWKVCHQKYSFITRSCIRFRHGSCHRTSGLNVTSFWVNKILKCRLNSLKHQIYRMPLLNNCTINHNFSSSPYTQLSLKNGQAASAWSIRHQEQ